MHSWSLNFPSWSLSATNLAVIPRDPIARRRWAQFCGESTSTLGRMALCPTSVPVVVAGKRAETGLLVGEHLEARRNLEKGIWTQPDQIGTVAGAMREENGLKGDLTVH